MFPLSPETKNIWRPHIVAANYTTPSLVSRSTSALQLVVKPIRSFSLPAAKLEEGFADKSFYVVARMQQLDTWGPSIIS